MIHKVGLTVLLYLSATSLSAQSLQIVNDLPALSRSISVNECSPTVFVSNPNKWSYPFASREHFMWMRAKITVDNPSMDKPWAIDIVVDNHTVQTLTRSDLAPDLHTLWSALVEEGDFTVQLRSSSNINGMKVCLAAVNVPTTAVSVKSVIDNNDDRVDLVATYGTHSRYYDYGKSVVLIWFQDVDNGGTESNCTGVVISPTLVATNNHCIDGRTNLRTSFVIIGHESGASVEQRVAIVGLVATCPTLDYSIIRVGRELKDVAKISVGGVKRGTHLILIQHPEARPKLIAVVSKKKCFVQQSPAQDRQTDFYHLCDSSGGSSGSPVMDEASGVVYGLHHLGATDPKRHDYHNLAVSFREISNDLKDRYPLIYQEITTVSRGAG